MKKIAIIVAAGSGTRAGGQLPKQLQTLAGKPVFAQSIDTFLQVDPDTEIIIVINPLYKDLFTAYMKEKGKSRAFKYQLVIGGKSRAESVMNGLAAISDENNFLIAVHDAARPLVSKEVIERGWQAARLHGATVPVIPLTDSIRQLKPAGESISVARKDFVAVQTPQVFNGGLLKHAYSFLQSGSIDAERVTDDASVVEAAGYEVSLYDGDPENMKITGPHDMQIAELILNHRMEK